MPLAQVMGTAWEEFTRSWSLESKNNSRRKMENNPVYRVEWDEGALCLQPALCPAARDIVTWGKELRNFFNRFDNGPSTNSPHTLGYISPLPLLLKFVHHTWAGEEGTEKNYRQEKWQTLMMSAKVLKACADQLCEVLTPTVPQHLEPETGKGPITLEGILPSSRAEWLHPQLILFGS